MLLPGLFDIHLRKYVLFLNGYGLGLVTQVSPPSNRFGDEIRSLLEKEHNYCMHLHIHRVFLVPLFERAMETLNLRTKAENICK